MALFRSGDEAKARETFQLAFEKPELKPRGLRSLAWLDLYHGKYATAKSRLAEALISDKVYKWSLSILREHNILAIVADGQGDSTGRMRELDYAVQYLAGSGIQVRPGLWLGLQYARAGNTAKASEILERVRPQADLQNVEDSSDLQTLEGEIELAKGNKDHAIELFLSADRTLRNAITLQSVARAYDLAGNADQAATWYETALAGDPVGYEAQQDWLAGRYHLAKIYFARGDAAKASAQLDPLLEAWKDADPALPLLRDIRLLHDQISSKH
jgi:tetratricopeptide (TPR) repeat protein